MLPYIKTYGATPRFSIVSYPAYRIYNNCISLLARFLSLIGLVQQFTIISDSMGIVRGPLSVPNPMILWSWDKGSLIRSRWKKHLRLLKLTLQTKDIDMCNKHLGIQFSALPAKMHVDNPCIEIPDCGRVIKNIRIHCTRVHSVFCRD